MRGFFEIGVYQPEKKVNYGTLLRSAYQLGAAGFFVIGPRFEAQSSDTTKADKHMPCRVYRDWDDFFSHKPRKTKIIAVESPDYKGARYLSKFTHPESAIYLLGCESCGLPKEIVEKCDSVVSLESIRTYSYNLAIAGSLVMYDRMRNRLKQTP